MKSILALVALIGILGCFNLLRDNRQVPSNSVDNPSIDTVSVKASENKGKIPASLSYEERKNRFTTFIQQLSASNTIAESDKLFHEARLFFPDTTLQNNAFLFGRRIASKDSIQIVFYEYTSESSPETGFHLASFLPTGRAIDVISIMGKSNDTNVSITLIDQAFFELEYVGFFLSDNYYQTNRYAEAPDSVKILESDQHTALQDFAWKKDYNNAHFYENYRLDEKGYFIKIPGHPTPSPSRRYAFASTRILSTDELDRYSSANISIMLNEIYADYGLQFSDTRLRKYFSKKPWYTPQFESVEDQLTAIEHINIAKLQARLQMAEK